MDGEFVESVFVLWFLVDMIVWIVKLFKCFDSDIFVVCGVFVIMVVDGVVMVVWVVFGGMVGIFVRVLVCEVVLVGWFWDVVIVEMVV